MESSIVPVMFLIVALFWIWSGSDSDVKTPSRHGKSLEHLSAYYHGFNSGMSKPFGKTP